MSTLRAAALSALTRGAPESATSYLERALAEPPEESAHAELLHLLGRAELAARSTRAALFALQIIAMAQIDRGHPGAELAAQRLTNREIADAQFITVRTVETHLTHTHAKLGVRGRRELAAALGSAPAPIPERAEPSAPQRQPA